MSEELEENQVAVEKQLRTELCEGKFHGNFVDCLSRYEGSSAVRSRDDHYEHEEHGG